MPIAVTEVPYRPVPLDPPRKRWTREECAALEAAGLLNGQCLELVEGELINKMGKKRPHVVVVTFIQTWLGRVFGAEFVNQEAPIDIAPEDNPTNEPQPDIIVLNRPMWDFQKNPLPQDLRLIVEVSDSRAGNAEYWVLDVAARRLIVHREPSAGRYAAVAAYNDQESVAPLAAPEVRFPVADAFRVRS